MHRVDQHCKMHHEGQQRAGQAHSAGPVQVTADEVVVAVPAVLVVKTAPAVVAHVARLRLQAAWMQSLVRSNGRWMVRLDPYMFRLLTLSVFTLHASCALPTDAFMKKPASEAMAASDHAPEKDTEMQ